MPFPLVVHRPLKRFPIRRMLAAVNLNFTGYKTNKQTNKNPAFSLLKNPENRALRSMPQGDTGFLPSSFGCQDTEQNLQFYLAPVSSSSSIDNNSLI